MVRELSVGKLSSYRKGAQISGVRTCLPAEDEGPKQSLSQKLLASVVHTLTCADYSWWDPERKMAPEDAPAKPSRAQWTPLPWLGRYPDVWGPKRGLPRKLYGSRLSQKLLASVVHTLTYADYFLWSPGTKI